MNSCKIREANLSGCYECERGALVDIICETDFGRSLATIVCPSARMVTTCETEGTKRTLSVHFEKARVDEECEVFCGVSSTRFQLTGDLAFPEVNFEADWTDVHGRPQLYHEIEGFDFQNLLG